MLKWLYWHFPIITTRKNIVRMYRFYEDRYDYVLQELKEIRKTCHKKDRLDDLTQLIKFWVK